MPSSVLFGTFLTLLSLALWKVLQARTSYARASLRYAAGFLGSLALAVALLSPGSQTYISTIEPLPNLSRLGGNLATNFAVICIHGMIVHLRWSEPDTAWRRQRPMVIAFVLASCLMTSLLLTAGTSFTVDFLAVYGGDARVIAYLLIQLGLVLTVLLSSIRLCVPLYRAATRWLRMSVGAFMIALAVFCSWAVWKASMLVLHAFLGAPATVEGPVSLLLGTVATGFIAISLLLSVAWSVLRTAREAATAYRELRVLRRLWLLVTEAVPDVVLVLPAGLALSPRRVRMARHRRLIEISDAVCVLAPWGHPEAEAWARTLLSEAGVVDAGQVRAVVGAADLMTALDGYRAVGGEARRRGGAQPPRRLLMDLEDPATARMQVAALDSPVVAVVRERARSEPGLPVGHHVPDEAGARLGPAIDVKESERDLEA